MLNLEVIQQQIDKIINTWFSIPAYAAQARLLKRGLYLIVFIHALYCFADYEALFGNNAYVFRRQVGGYTFRDAVYLLYYFPNYAVLVLSLLCILSGAGFVGKRHFISDAILLALQLNLHNAIYPGLNGGHQLLQQLLIFNVGLAFDADCLKSDAGRFFHRLCCLAIMLQVCVVYVVAGISKVFDATWQSGTAVWQAMQLKHFSLNDKVIFERPNFLTAFFNYATIVYQVAFPVCIWWKKMRLPLLLIGALFYVLTGLVMGLVLFAAVMLVSHLIFWPIKARN